MKLSEREELVYLEMKANPEKEWSVEDIAKLIYQKRGKRRPLNWQHTVTQTMRILLLKSMVLRPSVIRASGLGRGKKAVYALQR